MLESCPDKLLDRFLEQLILSHSNKIQFPSGNRCLTSVFTSLSVQAINQTAANQILGIRYYPQYVFQLLLSSLM